MSGQRRRPGPASSLPRGHVLGPAASQRLCRDPLLQALSSPLLPAVARGHRGIEDHVLDMTKGAPGSRPSCSLRYGPLGPARSRTVHGRRLRVSTHPRGEPLLCAHDSDHLVPCPRARAETRVSKFGEQTQIMVLSQDSDSPRKCSRARRSAASAGQAATSEEETADSSGPVPPCPAHGPDAGPACPAVETATGLTVT